MDVQMPQARRPRGDASDRQDAEHPTAASSSSRPSSATTTSSRRYAREPAASCSRTPRPKTSCARCASSPPATHCSRPSITRRVIEDYAQRSPPRKNAAPRPAHRARARGAAPARHRQEQRRARRAALPRRRHRQDPRLARARQAGPTRPGAGGRLRLRDTVWSSPVRLKKPSASPVSSTSRLDGVRRPGADEHVGSTPWPPRHPVRHRDQESGTIWGRLRCERHGVRCPAETGVPAVKVVGPDVRNAPLRAHGPQTLACARASLQPLPVAMSLGDMATSMFGPGRLARSARRLLPLLVIAVHLG